MPSIRAHTAATSAFAFFPPRPTEPAIRSSLSPVPVAAKARIVAASPTSSPIPSAADSISPAPPAAAGGPGCPSVANVPAGTSGSTSWRASALSMSALVFS
jgi:hypothetical protein